MEKINLKLFWMAMLAYASLVIVGIWLENTLPETYFKIPATLFVFGFANFLLWAPQVTYRFLDKQDCV